MSFLVLLLVALILLWSPWYRGFPRDVLQGWVQWAAGVGSGWGALAVVLALLLPVGLLLWLVEGLAYGVLTLLLHGVLLLCCVGRHDPLRSLIAGVQSAWERGDEDAAALVAEQQPGLSGEQAADLPAHVRARMVALCLQDYFVPAFWYLLLGPLGALGYRLVELTRQQWGRSVSQPAGMLVHALEWIPARLLALSFALVGQFDSTLRTVRGVAAEWDLSAGELVIRCARAAVQPAPHAPFTPAAGALEETRQLLLRAMLAWAVIIAFLSVLG